jgi:hypothetical protein
MGSRRSSPSLAAAAGPIRQSSSFCRRVFFLLVVATGAIVTIVINYSKNDLEQYALFITIRETSSASAAAAAPIKQHAAAAINRIPPPIESFSACLLVRDDNALLIEWLAFHYHVLPLRYLIVAVDPRSITSPEAILNRYQGKLMTIHVWKNDTFATPDEWQTWQAVVEKSETIDVMKDNPTELIRHRTRQRLFYNKCMSHFKQRGHAWTAMIDTDEFLHLDYDYIMQTTTQQRAATPPSGNSSNNPVIVPRSVAQPASVLSFLTAPEVPKHHPKVATACIPIANLRFGSAIERSEAPLPLGLVNTNDPSLEQPGGRALRNYQNFETLRYDHYAQRGSKLNIY